MTAGTARVAARDLALFVMLTGALTAAVLFLSDGAVLFTRPFWVDEWLMIFVANRATAAQVIEDLAAGADGGASLVHLVYWMLRHLVGTLTPTVVRVFSLICVLAAMAVVFVVLRRRCSLTSSVVGALAIGAHQLVVAHSYEGRFYGPWLLGAALVAWLLGRRQEARAAADPRGARRSAFGLAAAAFALCTTHAYGVVSLAILVTGALVAYRRRWRDGLQDVVPAAAGLLSLFIVVPLALGQRAAYTVSTWIPDFSVGQLEGLADAFWIAPLVLIGGAVLLVGAITRRLSGDEQFVRSTMQKATSDAALLALAATSLLPIALAVLSLAGQPSMLPRYAIVAALAWAPFMAIAADMGGKWAARSLAVAVVWFWVVAYVRESAAKASFASAVRQTSHTYAEARRANLPVVLYSIHVMYPLIGSAPGEEPARFVDTPDSLFATLLRPSTGVMQLNRGFILERDLARVHASRWGFPSLTPLAALDTTSRFLFFGPAGRLPLGFRDIDQFANMLFPHHRLTRLHPDVALLERVPVASSK